MSTEPYENATPSERLRSLELKAQAIRSRLMRAVDSLDDRRERAMEVGTYAKSIARPALLSLLGAVVVVGVGVLAVRSFVRSRRRRRLPELASRAASRAIQRIERARRPSAAVRLLQKAALTFATVAANEVVRLTAKRVAREGIRTPRLA